MAKKRKKNKGQWKQILIKFVKKEDATKKVKKESLTTKTS